jgi:hypothetical protein
VDLFRRVELVGTVQAPGTVRAPLSGAACVLYRVRLGLLQRLLDGWGDGGSRELSGSQFSITCRLGQVLVDCAGAAHVHLAPGRRHRIRLGQNAGDDARVAALYQRLLRHPPVRRTRVAALEQRLEPGGRVWVCGDLERVPDPGGQPAGYRQPPGCLVLQAQELAALPV